MTLDELKLWRLTWSHALGVYWLQCRSVTKDTAPLWKEIYEKDDRGAVFHISAKAPKLPEDAERLAQHVAKF